MTKDYPSKRQFALDLTFPLNLTWQRLTRHKSNSNAIKALEDVINGSEPAIIGVYGDPKSGKSCLAKLCQESTLGILITDDNPAAENVWQSALNGIEKNSTLIIDNPCPPSSEKQEQAVWHLLMRAAELKSKLILFTSKHPTSWNLELEDLSTRLIAMNWISLGLPDDQALEEMVKSGLTKQGFPAEQLNDDLMLYLLYRMERSYMAAYAMPILISECALKGKGNLTKQVFSNAIQLYEQS